MRHERNLAAATTAAAGLALAAALAHPAQAQQFANPDFSSGDLSGWTLELTPNGTTALQLVEPCDIDGPGPLPTSLAARFCVGNLVNMPGNQAGIDLVQMLDLQAGVEYAISFNWAVTNTNSSGQNTQGGIFSILAGPGPIGSPQAAGSTAAACARYGFIEVLFTPQTSGPQRIGIRITREFTVSAAVAATLSQWLDNADCRPAVRGACCLPDGACALLTPLSCAAQSGLYQGDDTDCASVPCEPPPTGACCSPAAVCTISSASACLASGGNFAGPDTLCADAPCPRSLTTPAWQSVLNTAGAGIFLDLRGLSGDALIRRLDLLSNAEPGNWTTVRLYTYPASYLGHDDSPDAWTLHESQVLRTGGTATPLRVHLSQPLVAPYLRDLGIYIVADGGGIRFRGTSTEPAQSTHTATGLRLFSDRVRSTPWSGVLTTQRSFSGTVFYTPGCFANCDQSTTPPILNILDFVCFLNRFGDGDTRANCDGSTTEPLLNVLDFSCFLNRFSAGCP
jgi:hypothetical protein